MPSPHKLRFPTHTLSTYTHARNCFATRQAPGNALQLSRARLAGLTRVHKGQDWCIKQLQSHDYFGAVADISPGHFFSWHAERLQPQCTCTRSETPTHRVSPSISTGDSTTDPRESLLLAIVAPRELGRSVSFAILGRSQRALVANNRCPSESCIYFL